MTYKFENASILVVDDMQPMLTLVSSILKILGFENVILSHDAQEAFDKFCQYNPDIVLTDWHMEPFDGIELTEKIRTDPKSPNRFVPIIMMTGYSHKIRVEQARDRGVTEFLVKPFRAKDLYTRIEQLIEKPRKFVDAEEFFGPDRRRRRGKDYDGPFRRDADEYADLVQAGETDASEMLRELRQKASESAKLEEKK